ncbi:MAG TPA: PEP-CTERM sorting domain-containing protein [Lacipirellula sp.]
MTENKVRTSLDGRLSAYLAAIGGGAAAASSAEAAVVGNTTVQPFGVNGVVSIDFNTDGQTDFQIDHDRVNTPGVGDLDYLQIDKNDVNGEANPLAFDPAPDATFQATPFMDGATPRNDASNAAYVINPNQKGSYPAALQQGDLIGPLSSFDWQESSNFQSTGKWIRANRLLDEDATQIDQVLGGRSASGVQVPLNGPNFDGLGGEVRYLGLKMELNNSGLTNYGWVGVRIDNEADATGAVVGYAYQSLPGVPIAAGSFLPVPEPSSLFLAFGGALALAAAAVRRRRS